MLNNFNLPKKIITGKGCLSEVEKLIREKGINHILLVTDKAMLETGLVDKVKSNLVDSRLSISVFDGVEPEPSYSVVDSGALIAREEGCDGVLGFGGGSAIDSAKGIALVAAGGGKIQEYVGESKIKGSGLPLIAVPTTAGTGSEVTSVAIYTDEEKELKVGIASPYIIPDIAIVDPELTKTVPAEVTAYTGMDALTHAIEAFVSVNATPETDALAIGAIKIIANNIRKAVADGSDMIVREKMTHGSLMAGMAFANAGVAAVHALAYPLGARYHLPHGVCNSMLLPFVMETSWIGNETKYLKIADIINGDCGKFTKRDKILEGINSIKNLISDVGLPLELKKVGVKKNEISFMAEAAIKVTRLLRNNPRKLTVELVEEIYKNAY